MAIFFLQKRGGILTIPFLQRLNSRKGDLQNLRQDAVKGRLDPFFLNRIHGLFLFYSASLGLKKELSRPWKQLVFVERGIVKTKKK